jgi:uncharacterized protein (DUF433 family)
MNTLLDRITINPAVCGGKPCVRVTRTINGLVRPRKLRIDS